MKKILLSLYKAFMMRNASFEVTRNGSSFIVSIVRNGKVLKQKNINFVSNEKLEQIFSTMKQEYIHG
jgi:hypothetical protein